MKAQIGVLLFAFFLSFSSSAVGPQGAAAAASAPERRTDLVQTAMNVMFDRIYGETNPARLDPILVQFIEHIEGLPGLFEGNGEKEITHYIDSAKAILAEGGYRIITAGEVNMYTQSASRSIYLERGIIHPDPQGRPQFLARFNDSFCSSAETGYNLGGVLYGYIVGFAQPSVRDIALTLHDGVGEILAQVFAYVSRIRSADGPDRLRWQEGLLNYLEEQGLYFFNLASADGNLEPYLIHRAHSEFAPPVCTPFLIDGEDALPFITGIVNGPIQSASALPI